nr:hypothetical protein [Microbacterium sp. 69-10]
MTAEVTDDAVVTADDVGETGGGAIDVPQRTEGIGTRPWARKDDWVVAGDDDRSRGVDEVRLEAFERTIRVILA